MEPVKPKQKQYKTKNLRISFVPSDVVRSLLLEVSGLSGQSMASLVSEMMDEIAPVVQGQITALRQIAGRPEKSREYVHDYANKAIAEVAQIALEFAPKHDGRTSEGQKAKRRAARAAPKP